MNRRAFLKLMPHALVLPILAPARNWLSLAGPGQTSRAPVEGLFFRREDRSRIRANAQTPLLRDYFQSCLEADLEADRQFLQQAAETRDLIRDLLRLQRLLRRESLVYLVTERPERRALILQALEAVLQMPKWDYFLNGGEQTLGLQRAPETVIAVLFARACLDGVPDDLERRLLTDVAEKGCLPCSRSLREMAAPEAHTGWHFDPEYAANYAVDMQRWPQILTRTNLKAVPIAGLGLGALALADFDARSEAWLELAVRSAREYLSVFQADGSYEENLGYADYSLRNLFLFFEAHHRLRGDVDWFDQMNFYGFAEFVVAMQIGRQLGSDLPDVVNFGDIRHSIFPATAFWIANRGGDALAQYAGQRFSALQDFADFLWYRPEQPARPPDDRLKNKRFDLDWIVCRTGWGPDDTVLAFRSGGPGNHEHADRNSLILKAHGERLLTDPFGAAYDWRDPAWRLRLTEAHNAVLIDGRGHVYHDGREGTNPSAAEARIVRFVDRGERVWWCSDATPAYRLVDPDVRQVLRAVLFVKPDLVLVHDRVQKETHTSEVAVRFLPDNRDGRANIDVGQNQSGFVIKRPRASLYVHYRATAPVRLYHGLLDVPRKKGLFPYLEVRAEPTTDVQILTVLVVRPRKEDVPAPSVDITAEPWGWQVTVGDRSGRVLVTGTVPEFVGFLEPRWEERSRH